MDPGPTYRSKTKSETHRASRALRQGIALPNNKFKVGDKLLEAAVKDNDEDDGTESKYEDGLNGNDPEEET